jgi:hypothetical protein
MKTRSVGAGLETSSRIKRWSVRVGIPIAAVLGFGAGASAAGFVTWNSGQTLTAQDLNSNFSQLQQAAVPSGAVMPFNLSQCPAGWSAFAQAAGRTIIGVNAPNGNGLSQRNLGDTLGEETHTMSVLEMPSHSHGLLRSGFDGTPGIAIGTPSDPQGTIDHDASDILQVQPSGGGKAFNNMQPSVALLYCVKN